MKKCYYEVMEVPTDSSLEDIKASFRRLSKETHPDMSPNQTCDRRFKEVSEAYQTLSNTKERRRYDLKMSDRFWYQNHTAGASARGHGHGAYSDFMRPPPGGPKATGVYGVLDTMFKPRNFLMGITGAICTMVVYQAFLGEDRQKKLLQQHHQGNQLVEAWKNPTTGRWEQAAPWDPTYRRLKPTLELVPREQVQSRSR